MFTIRDIALVFDRDCFLFEEILTDDYESKAGHRLLAEAANSMELARTALASVQLLVKLSPENKANCQLLANVLEKLGDYDKAEEILGKLVSKHTDDFKLRQIYKDFSARATINRGKYEKLSGGEGSVNDVVRDKEEAVAMSREQSAHKSDEILKEMRLAVMEAGRKLATHLRRKRRIADAERKKDYIKTYIPQIGIALQEILELTDRQRTVTENKLADVLERSRKM